MNKTEIQNQVFEIMLKAAVKENFERELRELPKEKDLSDDCELSQSAKTKIEKMIRKAHRNSAWLRIQTVTKKVAVLFAIIIPVSLGSLLSVGASRHAIFNAFLEWKSNHANIRYQDLVSSSGQGASSFDSDVIEPQYLPDGFIEYQRTQIGSETEIEYRNKQGIKIILNKEPLSVGENLGIDTEHTTEEEIEILGNKAFLFTANSSGECSYLVWNDHSYSYLLSSKISPQELVKIAESIKK